MCFYQVLIIKDRKKEKIILIIINYSQKVTQLTLMSLTSDPIEVLKAFNIDIDTNQEYKTDAVEAEKKYTFRSLQRISNRRLVSS